MAVIVIVLQSLPDGAQMLFAFVTPGLLVWWLEKRRAAKIEENAATRAGKPIAGDGYAQAAVPVSSAPEYSRTQ